MMLQVELAPKHKSGLLLKNPVMIAAGALGYGSEYARVAEMQRLGALVSTSTTLHSRSASVQVVETASGLLYPFAIPNPGVYTVRRKYAPIWRSWETPVLVSIAGETLEDLHELAEQLEGVAGVAGVELNTQPTGQQNDLAWLSEAVSTVRSATTLPLLVKLEANDLLLQAQTAIEAGADALVVAHPSPALSIDRETRQARPALGLVGPAFRPLAVRAVYELARALRQQSESIPLIGVGGICTLNDALEFLYAGATALQLGSINLANPRAGVEIVESLNAFMLREGVQDIQELIGAALP